MLAVVLGLVLVVPLVGGMGLVVWAQSQFPLAQGERVRGPHDLVGVHTGWSYAWVVPTATGVVVIDSGADPTGRALTREIGRRKVHAVLLTHGHSDTTAGLAAFPGVPVHVTAPDLALIRGEREPRGWMARTFDTMFGPAVTTGPFVTLTDGQELHIDGASFRVTAVPGHTDGSVAYLWDDVLFTGDAVLGGDPLAFPQPVSNDDPEEALRSPARLLPLDFDGLADGHVGFTGAARSALFRKLGEKVVEPTVTVRATFEPGAAGATRAAAERLGIYVQTPTPDVRGEQPALVVFEDGPAWRVAPGPVPERAEWSGKAVLVRARLGAAGAGAGVPVEIESIRLAEPQPDPARPLSARVGEWVQVRGVVREVKPLTRGATWGEGELVLPQGAARFAAPLAVVPLGAEVELWARIEQGGEAPLSLTLAP